MSLRIPFWSILKLSDIFNRTSSNQDTLPKDYTYLHIVKDTLLPHYQLLSYTTIIIVILIGIFILQTILLSLTHTTFLEIQNKQLPTYFFMQPSHLNVLAIFTSPLLHFSFMHLIMNSAILFILSQVEYTYGKIIYIAGTYLAGIYGVLMGIVLCQSTQTCDDYYAGASGMVYGGLGMLIVAAVVSFRAMDHQGKYMWACGISMLLIFGIVGLLRGSEAQMAVHGFGMIWGISWGLSSCRFINQQTCQIYCSYIFIPIILTLLLTAILIITI